MLNCLDPGQDRHNVRPDLGLKFYANDISIRQRSLHVTKKELTVLYSYSLTEWPGLL